MSTTRLRLAGDGCGSSSSAAESVSAAARQEAIGNPHGRHGVDPDLVHAAIAVESGYRATAQSPAGAQGLMQLMPGTQRDLGVADAFDPRRAVRAVMSSTTLPVCPKTGSTSPSLTVHLCLHTAPGNRECARGWATTRG